MESLRDTDRDVADDAIPDSGSLDDLFTRPLSHGSLTPQRPIRAGEIANEIRRSYQVSAHDGQEFLPHDKLGKIINDSVVRSLLLDLTSDDPNMEDADSLTNKIIGEPSRRKIFAVLVIMGKIRFIQDFIKGNITDDDLPLKVKRITSETEFCEELYKTHANLPDDPDREEHPEPLKSLTSWSFTMKEDFELRQRVVCAPLFELPGEKTHFYNLRDRPTLPLLELSEPQSGGYGTVRKVRIHNAHYGTKDYGKVR